MLLVFFFFISWPLSFPPQRLKLESIRGSSHQNRVRSHRTRVPHTPEGTHARVQKQKKKPKNKEVAHSSQQNVLRSQLQNLGCYSVSKLELRLRLPSVAAEDARFMTLTDVFSYNVSNDERAALILDGFFFYFLAFFTAPRRRPG